MILATDDAALSICASRTRANRPPVAPAQLRGDSTPWIGSAGWRWSAAIRRSIGGAAAACGSACPYGIPRFALWSHQGVLGSRSIGSTSQCRTLSTRPVTPVNQQGSSGAGAKERYAASGTHPGAGASNGDLVIKARKTRRGPSRHLASPDSGRPQGKDQRTVAMIRVRRWLARCGERWCSLQDPDTRLWSGARTERSGLVRSHVGGSRSVAPRRATVALPSGGEAIRRRQPLVMAWRAGLSKRLVAFGRRCCLVWSLSAVWLALRSGSGWIELRAAGVRDPLRCSVRELVRTSTGGPTRVSLTAARESGGDGRREEIRRHDCCPDPLTCPSATVVLQPGRRASRAGGPGAGCARLNRQDRSRGGA